MPEGALTDDAGQPVDWERMAIRLAVEVSQLKGVIGIMAARFTENYYGTFSHADIERGLSEEVRTIHHEDGSVTVMTGMGS